MPDPLRAPPKSRSHRSAETLRQSYLAHGVQTFSDMQAWIEAEAVTPEEYAQYKNDRKSRNARIGEEMPLFPRTAAAIPTEIGRCALFQCVPRGRRDLVVKEKLPSRNDLEIDFTGVVLDNGIDQILWLFTLGLARGQKIGERMWVSQRAVLREIGRSPGGKSMRNLRDALDRLASATLFVTFKRNAVTVNLRCGLLNWGWKSGHDEIFIRLDPDAAELFKNMSFVSLQTHLQLTGSVTRALHVYAATHRRGRQHSQLVDHLKEWFGYSGRPRAFLKALHAALEQLETLGVVKDGEIVDSPRGKVATWRLLSHHVGVRT